MSGHSRLQGSVDVDVVSNRKRKQEMNGAEDAASVSSNSSGNSECFEKGSSGEYLLKIRKLKAKLYDRDEEIKKLRRRKLAWNKEKRRLEQLCRKQASSFDNNMYTSINPSGAKLESCEPGVTFAVLEVMKQDVLPEKSTYNAQHTTLIDAEKAAPEELCTNLTREREALLTELTNVRGELAAARVLIDDLRVETEEVRSHHETALERATLAAQEAHNSVVLAAREEITKLEASLQEQRALASRFMPGPGIAAGVGVEEPLDGAATAQNVCTVGSSRPAAAAGNGPKEEGHVPSEVPSTGMADVRARDLSVDSNNLLRQQREKYIADMCPDIGPFAENLDSNAAAVVLSLREKLARARHILAVTMRNESTLLREKVSIEAALTACRAEYTSVAHKYTDTVHQNREAQQGLVQTIEKERVTYTKQLNCVQVRANALQKEVWRRDAQIRELLDHYRAKPGPDGIAVSEVELPPRYSAQLADLQAQVWELRAELHSRTARVTELEQQCLLNTTERGLYDRLRAELQRRTARLTELEEQCTLNPTERVLYEELRLAVVKKGANLSCALQLQKGYARIVAVAVAALKNEYPEVFESCAEIARERYPAAQGAAADYYTLAVYGYRARAAPSGDPQSEVANAAHNAAESGRAPRLGELLRDASRTHYSSESAVDVPSAVSGVDIMDLTKDDGDGNGPLLSLESGDLTTEGLLS